MKHDLDRVLFNPGVHPLRVRPSPSVLVPIEGLISHLGQAESFHVRPLFEPHSPTRGNQFRTAESVYHDFEGSGAIALLLSFWFSLTRALRIFTSSRRSRARYIKEARARRQGRSLKYTTSFLEASSTIFQCSPPTASPTTMFAVFPRHHVLSFPNFLS